MKILIAEDDVNIRNGLTEILLREGYDIITAENGHIALEKYQQLHPDFIILDIMMPVLDGYSVCREIRKTNETIPIIFLSAKDEEIDHVVGLELGADDYINKPFGVHEIKARIKTIARRCLRIIAQNPDRSFLFGDLIIYPEKLLAYRDDQRLELTLREVKIIECFYQNKNKVVSRDILFDTVWGYNHMPNSRTLDQHISKLRKIIERDPINPELIKTIHGVGYRYNEK